MSEIKHETLKGLDYLSKEELKILVTKLFDAHLKIMEELERISPTKKI